VDAIIRGVFIYLFIFIAFRVSGKRALSELTSFEFVLLLIIAETTQQALLGDDFSLTNSVILITTLLFIDILLSLLKQRLGWLDKWMEGVPLVIVENGRPLRDRMSKERIGEDDILESARKLQGLERMDQIKYAILEKTGGITIIPYSS
jgi:uncharacterized membrane protein YcaP (DUF421 family)